METEGTDQAAAEKTRREHELELLKKQLRHDRHWRMYAHDFDLNRQAHAAHAYIIKTLVVINGGGLAAVLTMQSGSSVLWKALPLFAVMFLTVGLILACKSAFNQSDSLSYNRSNYSEDIQAEFDGSDLDPTHEDYVNMSDRPLGVLAAEYYQRSRNKARSSMICFMGAAVLLAIPLIDKFYKISPL